jgi:hypothetical protein
MTTPAFDFRTTGRISPVHPDPLPSDRTLKRKSTDDLIAMLREQHAERSKQVDWTLVLIDQRRTDLDVISGVHARLAKTGRDAQALLDAKDAQITALTEALVARLPRQTTVPVASVDDVR